MSERIERRGPEPHDFYDHVDDYEQLLEGELPPYHEIIYGLEALASRTLEIPRDEFSGITQAALAAGLLPKVQDFMRQREQSLELFAMAPQALYGSFIELKYLGNESIGIDLARIKDWYDTTIRLVQSFDSVHGAACSEQNGDHIRPIPSCQQSAVCPHKFLDTTLLAPARNRTFTTPEDDREFSAGLVQVKLEIAEKRGVATTEEATELYIEYRKAHLAFYAYGP